MRDLHRRRRLAFGPIAAVGLLISLLGACGEPEAADSPERSLEPEASSEAEALLLRSIRFHDPGGVWSTGELVLHLEESRPDGPTRETTVRIARGGAETEIETQRPDDSGERHSLHFLTREDEVVALRVDGDDVADDDREQRLGELGLDEARLLRTRNYYVYLYGLPMKLRDPGTRLDPEVEDGEYDGRTARSIRVTYDPDVGGDTWIFYFDPESAEMIGYRFYHDEAANDGEYIHLEGLAEVGGLRLPKQRTWYTHQGDRLLGTDTIVER